MLTGSLISIVDVQVGDETTRVVASHLADLRLLPPELGSWLVGHGLLKIHIGDRPLADLDAIRGADPGSFRNLTDAGGYHPDLKCVYLGNGGSPSASVALHEIGHAVGWLSGAHSKSGFILDYIDQEENLPAYYRESWNGRHDVERGARETFAEVFAMLLTGRKQKAENVFGLAICAYVERFSSGVALE
ncbi:MAG: hypothetical protein EON58_21960 [Alphaproteobacteria bacterium]|nr:MAG: hypothetical protein EON58_21960 [Alphaproteobacteria bacterium]